MKIAGAFVLAVTLFAAFYVLLKSFAMQRRMEVKRCDLELALKQSVSPPPTSALMRWGLACRAPVIW
jgi:hypothetical protein